MDGHLRFDHENSIFYLHLSSTRDGAPTFVFVNALTGSTDHWEAIVAHELRSRGFGTLSDNLRGQKKPSFSRETELTYDVIVDDLIRVPDEVSPTSPILAGLLISGLYASQAFAGGASADGIVLQNTLREIKPRPAWISDVLPHYVATGGVALFMGLMMPFLSD